MTEWQSPKPLPTPLAMSTRRAASPPPSKPTNIPSADQPEKKQQAEQQHPVSNLPSPKLRFAINDLAHSGASKFLREISADKALQDAIRIVLTLLYPDTKQKKAHPPVRSITLILKPMDGVAYTTSNELDSEHKEIHLSLNYVDGQSADRVQAEILGVIVHEMVHVWQWSADGTPGGLIEGIADYVRLKAGFAPPHWRREPGGSWDAGYERTGFFLEWLEERFGEGKVVQINGLLEAKKYDENLWSVIFGKSVDDLFEEYRAEFDARKER